VNSSVTLPLSPTLLLQTNDQLGVLRRSDVEVTATTQGTYAATFTLGPVTLKRGWMRVTTELEGTPYHLVNTHLETQRLAPVQAAQAAELVGSVMAGLEGVTVLAGDLNSDAAHPGAPSWTPTYDAMIAAGFTDAWEKSGNGNRAGFTCCQAVDLRNPVSQLDERIDFVLVRDTRAPGRSGLPGSVRLEIVGEERGDLTPATGLWRADHAGLVATLRLPKGL
jgi:endonuclease/exonuclease/phosphatase family metal-dependent hydrolase